MARISDADDAAVADAYDFSRFRRIVDVGGGKGGLLGQILRRAPHATGILFDQPQVVTEAARLETAGVSARAERMQGVTFSKPSRAGVTVTSLKECCTISTTTSVSRYSRTVGTR